MGIRNFSAIHIDEDCTGITGVHDNELFYNCTFDKLKDLTLRNCDLRGSHFRTGSIRDALDFTVTLNCGSFTDVELSRELFDLHLLMLFKTAGNDEKREKLLDVIGRDRAKWLLSFINRIE